jgi:hypothetical protein
VFVVVLNRESCFCRSVCIFVVLLEVGENGYLLVQL